MCRSMLTLLNEWIDGVFISKYNVIISAILKVLEDTIAVVGPDLEFMLEELHILGELCEQEGINPKLIGEASARWFPTGKEDRMEGNFRLSRWPYEDFWFWILIATMLHIRSVSVMLSCVSDSIDRIIKRVIPRVYGSSKFHNIHKQYHHSTTHLGIAVFRKSTLCLIPQSFFATRCVLPESKLTFILKAIYLLWQRMMLWREILLPFKIVFA